MKHVLMCMGAPACAGASLHVSSAAPPEDRAAEVLVMARASEARSSAP